jgi:hypothetical protein
VSTGKNGRPAKSRFSAGADLLGNKKTKTEGYEETPHVRQRTRMTVSDEGNNPESRSPKWIDNEKSNR